MHSCCWRACKLEHLSTKEYAATVVREYPKQKQRSDREVTRLLIYRLNLKSKGQQNIHVSLRRRRNNNDMVEEESVQGNNQAIYEHLCAVLTTNDWLEGDLFTAALTVFFLFATNKAHLNNFPRISRFEYFMGGKDTFGTSEWRFCSVEQVDQIGISRVPEQLHF